LGDIGLLWRIFAILTTCSPIEAAVLPWKTFVYVSASFTGLFYRSLFICIGLSWRLWKDFFICICFLYWSFLMNIGLFWRISDLLYSSLPSLVSFIGLFYRSLLYRSFLMNIGLFWRISDLFQSSLVTLQHFGFICLLNGTLFMCVYVCLYVSMCVYVCLCVSMCVYMCLCVSMCVYCVCLFYTHIYMWVYFLAHTWSQFTLPCYWTLLMSM